MKKRLKMMALVLAAALLMPLVSSADRNVSAFVAKNMKRTRCGSPVKMTTGMAVLHDKGGLLPQNLPLAAHIYRLTAGSGYAPAQYRLGQMYAAGEGVAKDKLTAYRWLSAAAAGSRGNARYIAAKDDIAKQLPPKIRADADKSLAAWLDDNFIPCPDHSQLLIDPKKLAEKILQSRAAFENGTVVPRLGLDYQNAYDDENAYLWSKIAERFLKLDDPERRILQNVIRVSMSEVSAEIRGQLDAQAAAWQPKNSAKIP